jgi:hypothetical protein
VSLWRFTGTGYDGVVTVGLCPGADNPQPVTAYFYDYYPTAVLGLGQPYGYGAMTSVTVGAEECCGVLGVGTLTVSGAMAVKITSNIADYLHLTEVQVFDVNGNNVALASAGTRCYSRSTGWNGDPAALNDGVIGMFPTVSNSHSAGPDPGNYDLCVFAAPVRVARVVVYPFIDPSRVWMTSRLRDLTVTLHPFARGMDAVGNAGSESGGISLVGDTLASFGITTFSSTNWAPQSTNVTLGTLIPCPSSGSTLPSKSYQAEYNEVCVGGWGGGVGQGLGVCIW